jgi:hypothetical protein
MAVDHQLGVKNETVYGTPVTVDEFFEHLPGDPIAVETGRVESGSLRAGQTVQLADRFQPYTLGASGSRTLEVLTGGFDWWLQHMLGTLTTETDEPVEGATSHIGTLGNLFGKSFTWQENVPLGVAKQTNQAFTYGGGKINTWTLSCETEGVLTLEVEVVFANHTTATALATASYPTGLELLSWAYGRLSVGGVAVPVTSWSVSGNNNLKTDRHYIAGSGASPSFGRKEPVVNGFTEITAEFECDLTVLSLGNRCAATARSSTIATLEVVCEGPAVIAGSTYPSVSIEIPALRFDEASLGSLGMEQSMQSLSGVGLDNGTDEPITITYVTAA